MPVSRPNCALNLQLFPTFELPGRLADPGLAVNREALRRAIVWRMVMCVNRSL